MTLYVKAAEAVRKAFGCLCVIVHHCGYDDTHARGHTSPVQSLAQAYVFNIFGWLAEAARG